MRRYNNFRWKFEPRNLVFEQDWNQGRSFGYQTVDNWVEVRLFRLSSFSCPGERTYQVNLFSFEVIRFLQRFDILQY